jgi:hypothetical protein
MPAPFFTTNESEIPLLEGLYIKERTPPAAISGANLSEVCIVGTTIRGPVGRAIEVTNEARFEDVFGARDLTGGVSAIQNNVWKSLMNKPFGLVKVVRVAAAAAATATHNFSDAVPTVIFRLDANGPGAYGNSVSATVVVPSTDGVAGRFDLKVTDEKGKQVVYPNLDLTGTNDNSAAVMGTDDANVVVLTKVNSGTPVAATSSLSGGTDGTVADSDYTTTGKGLPVAAAAKNCAVVFVAEYMSAAVKASILTLSATVNDRIFLMGADNETISEATAITDVASFRSDRIVYCFNHPYTQDPTTAGEIISRPESWLASILSQIDIDIHPGEEDTKQYTAGITRLYHEEYLRNDYKALKAAGICALEDNEGFAFVSGVTTSLTNGKTQITRRRMADFLQLSVADALKHSVKKKNTDKRRKQNAGMIIDYLQGLQDEERVVNAYQVDTEKLNTPSGRAAGIERILMRVDLISHMLELVLETEIGTNVVIVTERS